MGATQPIDRAGPSLGGRVKRVVAIDEDAAALRHLTELLEAEGCDVSSAPGAVDGMRAMGPSGPDLVFVELYMEGVDGLEFLDRVRASHPGVPVVVLSSPSRPAFNEMAAVAVHLGARAVLSKPVSPDELRTVMAGILPT